MTELISLFELRQLRRAIGASPARMAQLLGLGERNDAAVVRQMESGDTPISGTIQRLAKTMQEGVAEGAMNLALPQYMICGDLGGDIDREWIFHTRYPRFLATVVDDEIEGLICASTDGVEWLAVAMWLDEPVADPDSYVLGAAQHLAKYTADSIAQEAEYETNL